MPELRKLLEPGKIGAMEVKNRVVFPPMATHMASWEGDVTDQLIDYYAERAVGGVGLIVIEGSFPNPVGHPKRIALDDDRRIPGLVRLIDAIHRGGAKVVIEVNTHMGRQDQFPLSPSDVPHPFTGVVPRPATLGDIERMRQEYGRAARRVREAGFDGIMIHGGTGYLVAEFLSPLVNKRTDEYGGDVRRRARFACELARTAREQTAPDFPILFRVMSHDRVAGGLDTEDACIIAALLEEHGVDAIDVTTGSAVSHEWTAPPMYMDAGCNRDVSGAVRRHVRIPVIVCGKINDPFLAEQILTSGDADFVDIGRSLIADPRFVEKAAEGKTGDIRRCIACCRCGEKIVMSKDPVLCSVNPEVGREAEFRMKMRRATTKKRVLVIGAGPAGIQSALIADRRGHEVHLWEKAERLGGSLALAVKPSGKQDMANFLEYLERQLHGSGVRATLEKEATLEAVKEFAPEAIVVAAGATPFVLGLPGGTGQNVTGYLEVLSGKKKIAGKRAVVWGAGLVGCEVAYFLGEQGKEVTLIFPEPEPLPEVGYPDIKKLIVQKLRANNVRIEASITRFIEITPQGIRVVDKTGEERLIEGDAIVLATGARPQKQLFTHLKKIMPEVHEAGDCVNVRRLLEAVLEGALVGLSI